MRQTLSSPVYFGSYEVLKRAADASSDERRTGALATMMCGGVAGVSAYASTYPFDILKSYAHAAPPGTPAPEVRMLAVGRQMRREYGRGWFVRGIGPTLGRAFVINAVNFIVYEEVVGHIEE